VADIAAAAGLNRNQIFNYFGSKEQLVQDALAAALAVWRGDVAEAAGIFPQPERQMAHAVQQLAVLQGRGWPGLRLIAALALGRDGLPLQLQAATDKMLDEVGGFFRRLFKESRKGAGYALAEAKPRQLGFLLLSALLGSQAAGTDAAEQVGFLQSLLFKAGPGLSDLPSQ
jgi:AcrR family transcriptional regulator